MSPGLEEIGSYVRGGIQKLGEGVAAGVVDTVVSRLSQTHHRHIGNIETLQKLTFVKLVQRYVTSRFLHRQPAIFSGQRFSARHLLSVLQNPASDSSANLVDAVNQQQNAPQLAEEKCQSRAIGSMTLVLEEGRWLSFNDPHVDNENFLKHVKWKVGLSCHGDRIVIPCEGSTTRRMDSSLPHPGFFVDFDNVIFRKEEMFDLWDDCVIDIFRSVDESDESSAGESSAYGRAIIPMSTFIQSYQCTSSDVCGSFWLHLFQPPIGQLPAKYWRPVPGYSGFGCANPRSSLGFIKVSLKFEASKPFWCLPSISILNPPIQYWGASTTNFEPQFFEAIGLRMRKVFSTYPRWTRKFFHIFSRDVQRNSFDRLCLAFCHLVLVFTFLFSSLWQIPLSAFFLCCAFSLSYRFGAPQSPPTTRNAALYPTKLTTEALVALAPSTPQHAPDDSGRWGRYPDQHTGGPAAPYSEVSSPFGLMRLRVSDSTSYCPHFPPFADDCGSQDLNFLIQCLFALFDFIQYAFGSVVGGMEKLKFAFNWDDSLVSSATLALLFVLSAVTSVSLWALSCVPFTLLRCGVLVICELPLFLSDPEILSSWAPLYLRRMAVWLGVSQPHSVFCRLTAQDFWDFAEFLNEIKRRRETPLDARSFPWQETESAITRKADAWVSTPTPRHSILRFLRRPATVDAAHQAQTAPPEQQAMSRFASNSPAVCPESVRSVLYRILRSVVAVAPSVKLLARLAVRCCDIFLWWWIRLPDRREWEHRQIAALQFLDSLPNVDTVVSDLAELDVATRERRIRATSLDCDEFPSSLPTSLKSVLTPRGAPRAASVPPRREAADDSVLYQRKPWFDRA